jgi:hypothetical protein
MNEVLAAQRKVADRLGVYLLDADELVLGDSRFLGATLWTDFPLYGTGSRLLQAMNDAEWAMNDFRLIRHSDVEFFCPEHAREIFDGPTVAITHYLPHRHSIHSKYEGDRLLVIWRGS